MLREGLDMGLEIVARDEDERLLSIEFMSKVKGCLKVSSWWNLNQQVYPLSARACMASLRQRLRKAAGVLLSRS